MSKYEAFYRAVREMVDGKIVTKSAGETLEDIKVLAEFVGRFEDDLDKRPAPGL